MLQVCVWYRGTVVLWYQPTVLPGTDWLARVAWAEVCRGPGLLQVTSPAREHRLTDSNNQPAQDNIQVRTASALLAHLKTVIDGGGSSRNIEFNLT